jgi:hypothetical protein
VRFVDNGVPEPVVAGQTLAEGTWSVPYGDLPLYTYVDTSSIHGHWNTNRNQPTSSQYYKNLIVALSDSEALLEFGTANEISQDKLQRADIMKVNQIYFGGAPLTYGVRLDGSGNVMFDLFHHGIPEYNDPAQYHSGSTIVLPVWYSGYYTRFYYNFSNPAVRKYLELYAEKLASKNPNKIIGLDNLSSYADLAPYYAGGTNKERTQRHAALVDEILAALTTKGYKLLINTYTDTNTFNSYFRDYVLPRLHYWGVMVEERFHSCMPSLLLASYNGVCPLKDIVLPLTNYSADYLDFMRILRLNGKKAFYVAQQPVAEALFKPQSVNPWRIWLFVHLLAFEGTYLSMTSAETKPMEHYSFYDTNLLGEPVDEEVTLEPAGSRYKYRRRYSKGDIYMTPGDFGPNPVTGPGEIIFVPR